MIGAFVMIALVLAVAGVVVFGSGKFFAETHPYVLYFEGSVKGLNVGSTVAFRGAKLGTVTDIKLRAEGKKRESKIAVFIELEPDRVSEARGVGEVDSPETMEQTEESVQNLIDRGLRAQLELQSIVTGQLMVCLDYYPDEEAVYRGVNPEHPEIPTIASSMEKLREIPIDQIANELLSALKGIERRINSAEMEESFQALNDAIVEAKELIVAVNDKARPLGEKLERVLEDTSKLVRNVDGQVEPVAESLKETLTDTRTLVRNADERVTPLVEGTLQDTRELVRNVNERVEPLSASLQKVTAAATASLNKATETLDMVQGLAPRDSALVYEMSKTLKSMNDAMNSLKQLTDYLERHPEALLKGKK